MSRNVRNNKLVDDMKNIIKNEHDISYSHFEKLFGNLGHKQQYKVLERLNEHNIQVVEDDELEEEPLEEEEEFIDVEFFLEESLTIDFKHFYWCRL